MNNYLEIHDPPVFNAKVTKVTEEDLITDELENDIKGKLLNNDIFLQKLAEKIAERLTEHTEVTEIHVTTEKTDKWDGKADNVLATPAQNGLMLSSDKTKIDSIAAGAEVNQFAINNIRVGNTNVYSNGKEGQLILVPGSNVTIDADNATKKITLHAIIPHNLPANGGHASTCDRAYNANNADRIGGRTFNWSGQGGQPAYVWGANDPGTDSYVWNPSNFSVNHANSANTCNRATNANWADGATNANSAGAVRGHRTVVYIGNTEPSDKETLWVQ